jgi:DNA polymerase III epsilon subunit-like protein
MILFIDTETTGINPKLDRLVQIAWITATEAGDEVSRSSMIVRPDGFAIPFGASQVHGITTELALRSGVPLKQSLLQLQTVADSVSLIAAHNLSYDLGILKNEYHRAGLPYPFTSTPGICTMRASTSYCCLPKKNGSSGFKYPKLEELYRHLFGYDFLNAHNAEADTEACMKCFFKLIEVGQLDAPHRPRSSDQYKDDRDSFSDFGSEYTDIDASDRNDVIVELKKKIERLNRALKKRDQKILDLQDKLEARNEKVTAVKRAAEASSRREPATGQPSSSDRTSPSDGQFAPAQFKSLPIGAEFRRRGNQSICVKISKDEFHVGKERVAADAGEWVFVKSEH